MGPSGVPMNLSLVSTLSNRGVLDMAETSDMLQGGETPAEASGGDRKAAIQVRNLTKYYGDFLAVDNISFEVWDGEVLGFLGPNGAGKSTTLKMLTCFMPATAGKISVAGYDVFSQSLDVRKNVGYMPENTPLYTEMRVREFLHFRASIKGVRRSQRSRRISEVVEMCAIGEVEKKIIGQLSKGFRQRVGLADALIADPPILVLDEPLASLDPNQQTQSKKLIKNLKGKHTIIFSTHILSDVEEICDRMVIIDRGKMIASGSPDELAQRFQEENHLRVEIVGPKDEVRKTVEGIQGVRSVEMSETDGVVVIKVKTETETDVREKLSQTVIERNWGLREMRSERMELTEIFGRLTHAD